MQNNTAIPLSLYIHTPWCIKKCPYCDFNSHAIRKQIPEQHYLSSLLADLQSKAAWIQQRQIQSIFIGGGTPSLLSATFYKKLITELKQRLIFSQNIEITLEANPGAVDKERFEGFRAAGINRLSIGIQSFAGDALTRLGRVHTTTQALSAIAMAKRAGFSNFNLDLMFGLPQQSVEMALTDLQMAIELKTPHISWYQLTIEPNTLFHHSRPQLPDDELIWQMQQLGLELLNKNKLKNYEISAYAKRKHKCLHNLNYWQFGDYIGIGAGAHSKITELNTGTIFRAWNIKHPENYLKANANNFLGNKLTLQTKNLALEFLMNALRLNNAVPFSLIEARTGLTKQDMEPALSEAQQKNLVTVNSKQLETTSLGKRFLNNLLEIFLVQ